ncbi:MAG: ABC transporter ATP-binding protein, partial [Rhizobiales bacterium]|nr:ABC transporter ATP-binding protein [Hyphomicrobiales bacterium]
ALSAWIISDVVDQVFVDRNIAEVTALVVAVIVISVARGVSLYGSSVIMTRISNAIRSDIQMRVFDHLVKLGVNYFDKTPSSDLIAAMTQRASSPGNTLKTVLTTFGREVLSLVGLVTVMIIQSPGMSFIVLVIGPIAVVGVRQLVKRIRNAAKGELEGMTGIIAATQESAQGIRIVKAFNLEPVMRQRTSNSVEWVRMRSNRIGAITAATSPMMETLGGFAIAGVMLWAGYQTIFADSTPGPFVSFITALLLAYEPAKRLANTRVVLERDTIGAKTIFRILDAKPGLDSNPDGPELEVGPGEIVFRDVTFGYRTKKPVLRNFDFTAAAGKVTALVGPSGSGKSTIINLIERFYDVQSGAIEVDGQNISTVRLASLRNNVALVSQDTVIFRATVRENIRFGRLSATDEEVEVAARNAMADEFITNLPEGYDTELEAGGGQLSGGQRQRLANARAMLRDAPILLLDEATSALDAESEHQVQIAFDRLMAGRTTIVIAHRLSTVLGADRICVMVNGEIVESGRHAELLQLGKHYARIYHLQFERHVEPRTEGPGGDDTVAPLVGEIAVEDPDEDADGEALLRAGLRG